MTRINLLPWREAQHKQRQREFGTVLAGSLLLTLTLAFYVYTYIEGMIEYQHQRNGHLQSEIAKLDRKIAEIKNLEKTKANLIARMNIIQQLQESRPEIVHLFDELVNTLPEGVFLTGVRQSGSTISIEGNAQSNSRVSAYMRNIEASRWLGNPKLLVIEAKDKTGTGMSHFRLQAQQIRPKAMPPAAAGAQSAAMDGNDQPRDAAGGAPGLTAPLG